MTDRMPREIVKGLRALSNERRLRIAKLLLERGKMTVGDIAKGIGLSFKSTSRHLQHMASADLVDATRSSIRSFYELNKQHPLFRSDVLSLLR